MAKWWHILATVGMGALAAAVPAVQSALTGHPTITAIFATMWAVLTGILQSPVKPSA